MFFVASKVLWTVIAPANLLLLLLVAGCALLWTSWRRSGRRLVTAVAAAGLLLAMFPVGAALLLPLEDRFPPPPALPEHVHGIVILGGAIRPEVSESRGDVALNNHGERITVGVHLARRHPEARVVFTGGSARLWSGRELKEATFAGPLLINLGVAPDRLVLESRSRNTHENAVNTKALVAPGPDEVWLLVTSAFHMPRSVGVFRAAGWEVLPYPVDYQLAPPLRWWPPSLDVAGSMSTLNLAVHEWIGLAAYRLAGRTDTLFPAPNG
ncbi:MAG: YdcF family protein [Rhodospirillales bacterium]|nr:MAG: YdcF family protein [Rhodospirillales bacterium]